MLRKVMLAAIGFALLAGPAFGQAQKAKIVSSCGSLSYDVRGDNSITMDATGVLCTSAGGGGSSSSPFTPNGNYQTLTSTASSSASTALPAGATVAYQNASAVDVSCVLATGAATATTNKIIVRAGSTVFVTVGSNVNTACINQTGAASNTIVLAGGTGLGTNFGGGSGGGGGGAVTIASGAVASGAYSSGAFASGAYSSGSLAAGAMVDLLTVIGSKAGGTAAASSVLSGGVYNTSAPTLTNGQQAAFQLDVNGNQKVTVTNTLAAVGNNADDVAAAAGAASPVVSYNYVWDGTNWDRQRPTTAATPFKLIAAASNNSTLIASGARTVISYQTSSISASTPYWLKFYDKATAPTCGTDTPVKVILIPPTNSGNNGNIPGGVNVTLGLGICVVGGIADSDNTSVAASTVAVNVDYK